MLVRLCINTAIEIFIETVVARGHGTAELFLEIGTKN